MHILLFRAHQYNEPHQSINPNTYVPLQLLGSLHLYDLPKLTIELIIKELMFIIIRVKEKLRFSRWWLPNLESLMMHAASAGWLRG